MFQKWIGEHMHGGPIQKPALSSFDPLYPTIFHETWWLDLVTQGQIDVVESREHGRVVGRLPFMQQKRFNIRSSNMPAFTHFLGPAINQGGGEPKTRFLRQMEITRDLIGQLPEMASFRQKLHGGINEVIAFQAAKFTTSVQFTFEIRPADLNLIWRNMRDKTRNAIRAGEKLHSVDGAIDPDEFIGFYKANLKERSIVENVDMALCRSVIAQCLHHGRGRFWVARNDFGVIKAAIFCIWDSVSCYYFLSTRTHDNSAGAVPLLIWSAIQAAVQSGKVFDFDGLGSVGSVLFYSGFGGAISPRYIVSKASLTYRLLRTMRRKIEPVYNPFC